MGRDLNIIEYMRPELEKRECDLRWLKEAVKGNVRGRDNISEACMHMLIHVCMLSIDAYTFSCLSFQNS